jgi:hypothetical protein
VGKAVDVSHDMIAQDGEQADSNTVLVVDPGCLDQDETDFPYPLQPVNAGCVRGGDDGLQHVTRPVGDSLPSRGTPSTRCPASWPT